MKSFRKFVAEVAQPKPEEEKRFKDQHEYEVVAHPVAEPHQHTGEIQKPKAKRLADQEGEANYDKAVKNPEKRMAAESVEEEQLDEISKDLAGRYIKKAQVDSADAGMDTASQDKDIRKRGINKFLKRRKGVDSAVKRLMKPEELSPKQKKLDHNKNGKIDGHDLAMLRAKKKNEEADLEEGHATWEVHFHNSKHHKPQTVKGRNTAEAIKKAEKRASAAGPKGQIAMYKGIKKVSEEVELDETTTSAIKKPVTMTGPDGKTRTVMKKAKADQTDDRGQDKIATNESVEMIDEAIKFKKGPIRLKDGSQIMVSKEDADLLNQMFKDLSARNQREMEKVAMADKAGFEEIRGFAREAL